MIRANFTASLTSNQGDIGISDTSLPVTGITTGLDIDGWLCARNEFISEGPLLSAHGVIRFLPITFKFQYTNDERGHPRYTISADNGNFAYTGARLEVNRNGWLGLYSTHLAGRIVDSLSPFPGVSQLRTNSWRIEALEEWDGSMDNVENIDFHLYNYNALPIKLDIQKYVHEGFRSTVPFLRTANAGSGSLMFRLRDIKLI